MEAKPDGLRARKKQETRFRLAHEATLLFIERGFENVTIAEVAEAAGVSKMTVTNYFPLKEDLVFDARAELVDGLARLVRERVTGESVLDAVQRGFGEAIERAEPLSGCCTRAFARLVHGSPRLRAVEWEMTEESESSLVAALADDAGEAVAGLRSRLLGATLAGAHRTLFRETRNLIRSGVPVGVVQGRMANTTEQAFALIRSGFTAGR